MVGPTPKRRTWGRGEQASETGWGLYPGKWEAWLALWATDLHSPLGPHAQKGSALGLMIYCDPLEIINNFEQGTPHFYFAPHQLHRRFWTEMQEEQRLGTKPLRRVTLEG